MDLPSFESFARLSGNDTIIGYVRRTHGVESSCSHSGKLLSDIKVPEVISLRVWIGQVRLGYPKNTLLNVFAVRRCVAKLLPVIKPPASNYVVDCCKCPLRMIQMTVQHSLDYSSLDVGNGSRLVIHLSRTALRKFHSRD